MPEELGQCVECHANVSIAETRRTGKCPACGDDFPMLMDDNSFSVAYCPDEPGGEDEIERAIRQTLYTEAR